ncbi:MULTISPECIES: acyl-CoA thioesterase [Spongiibacter]|uniref:acyl-CoA thioesterase n=1 Tax=Spongiibacter TaxID=630749 RepID=UPI000C0B6326|nr:MULTISPECIES: thioesterase family protein [Spongiibacter]MAK42908.1 thioesterase [Spongiibacter sp.]MBM7423479.1 acyl-CoA thioesterase FadM [Spongiibacter marinus]|tara:strand:- start:243 stop:671 length:429 start_codon:yes stop_codon:yes gene_type:complete
MAKLEFAVPEAFPFSTDIALLRSHINAGNHLGNDALVSLLNEARGRFLASRGVREGGRDDGLGMVNADMAVRYLSEAHYGEVLRFDVAASDFHRCGFDIAYRVSDVSSGRAVAVAKTAHLVVSPELGRAVDAPAEMVAALKG